MSNDIKAIFAGTALAVLIFGIVFLPQRQARISELDAKEIRADQLTEQLFSPVANPMANAKQEEQTTPKYAYWKTIRCLVTAYTPAEASCGKFSDGYTSTGKNAWLHADGVAADPKAVPYGSMVFIPGVGYREVDDTGRAMRDNWQNNGLVHLDIRLHDETEAKKWGVRELNIDLYKPISSIDTSSAPVKAEM